MDGQATAQESIGVAEVAAEMRYTEREAWEYIRSIGLVATNARKMKLARFTRTDFLEARDRSKAALPPRARTGALASPVPTTKPATKEKVSKEDFRASMRAQFKIL